LFTTDHLFQRVKEWRAGIFYAQVGSKRDRLRTDAENRHIRNAIDRRKSQHGRGVYQHSRQRARLLPVRRRVVVRRRKKRGWYPLPPGQRDVDDGTRGRSRKKNVPDAPLAPDLRHSSSSLVLRALFRPEPWTHVAGQD